MKVAGFVYLQSIGQNRIPASALLSYEIFRSICLPLGPGRTVMASKQWETVLHHPSAGEIREKMLQDVWKDALDQGALYKRIKIMDPKSDTEDIFDYILQNYASFTTETPNELFEWDKRFAQAEQRLREMVEGALPNPQTQNLPREEEEAAGGFVRWVRGLCCLKNESVSPR